MVGFKFKETMAGSYSPAGQPDAKKPLHFTISVSTRKLLDFAIDKTTEIEGTFYMQDLADFRPLKGTLKIDPILGKLLVYDFDFEGNDGGKYHFHGEKHVKFLSPIKTMTTMDSVVKKGDEVVANAVLAFDVRADMLDMLLSFRPVLG